MKVIKVIVDKKPENYPLEEQKNISHNGAAGL